MAEGEVSLWIRVRDGFTAGINSAKSALNGMVTSSADVARGASSALGGELRRIWGGISDNLGRVLGDVPGVRKMVDILKNGQASIVGAAMAGATAIGAMIGKISARYAELAGEIEKTSLRIANKQEQLLSKFASAKTGEAFTALDRDLIGEISALEQELSTMRSQRKAGGLGGRAFEVLTGTSSLERAKETQLQNAIALLERQRTFAQSRAGTATQQAAEKEASKIAGEQLRNSQEAAVSMRDAARAIAMAANEDKEGALVAEADRLKAEIESLNRALSTGVAQWTNENRAALQSLVSDYERTSIDLIRFREKEAKDEADAKAKAAEESAKKQAEVEKKAVKDRQKAMEKRGAEILAQAREKGDGAINAAQAAADRANFRNRPQTFKEQLDAFIARRDEQRAAVADNQKLLERESKIREKLQRGIGISKKDEQLLKDMAQLRAGQRADAAAAARKKQVEDAIINLEKKVESVLQASGGPN